MTENKHTVVRIPSLHMEARLIPNGESPLALHDFGYANGYVGVDIDHPFYELHYNDVFDKISVHGGLTFSGRIKSPTEDVNDDNWLDEDLWWFGFDTRHHSDRIDHITKDYCLNEVINLACQLATFTETRS